MVQSKFFNMGQILITRGISETVGESERFAAEVIVWKQKILRQMRKN